MWEWGWKAGVGSDRRWPWRVRIHQLQSPFKATSPGLMKMAHHSAWHICFLKINFVHFTTCHVLYYVLGIQREISFPLKTSKYAIQANPCSDGSTYMTQNREWLVLCEVLTEDDSEKNAIELSFKKSVGIGWCGGQNNGSQRCPCPNPGSMLPYVATGTLQTWLYSGKGKDYRSSRRAWYNHTDPYKKGWQECQSQRRCNNGSRGGNDVAIAQKCG